MTIAIHRQKIKGPNLQAFFLVQVLNRSTASSPGIVRLPHRLDNTVRAMVLWIATGAAHEGSVDWALHHLF